MLKVLSSILCDLDPKVKVIGQKAGICDGLPSTSALVLLDFVVCRFLFTKLKISKSYFRNTTRVPNSFNPHQTRHFVGSGLCPNFSQRSADDTSRQIVKIKIMIKNWRKPQNVQTLSQVFLDTHTHTHARTHAHTHTQPEMTL